ncbi:Alpha/Beta hydrolase protein [Naematelia encephala]|uniref:Alpha/Beta hydrolase protein n=1 Tax=Naematelia encephala TaxID=71784 RepID=A0A1Y2AS84_9TREE|nr:Alpha/Beta hydrolase protein [Naematelia encephala]
MSKLFAQLPFDPTISVTPYNIAVPEETLEDLKSALDTVRPVKTTFENTNLGNGAGVTKEWIDNALKSWKNEFDWREIESELNSYPNYLAHVTHKDEKLDVHFIGLFSNRKDAVPVIMSHGWPGNIIEFVPVIRYLTKKYTPETLPVHLIVPSLIGFGFSAPPPLTKEWTNLDTATVFDQAMRGLGFESYLAQGGDIGSYISILLGDRFEACKAVHLNMIIIDPPADLDRSALTEKDKAALERYEWFENWEFAYAQEHATKTSTIGMVIGSNPIALLAWIGEKLIVWSDETPSLDLILANISLYYLTSTFPTSLYHYRTSTGPNRVNSAIPRGLKGKPLGFSHFPKEIRPVPLAWIEADANYDVSWFRAHEKGGHFAALEQPESFWSDVEAFIKEKWPN